MLLAPVPSPSPSQFEQIGFILAGAFGVAIFDFIFSVGIVLLIYPPIRRRYSMLSVLAVNSFIVAGLFKYYITSLVIAAAFGFLLQFVYRKEDEEFEIAEQYIETEEADNFYEDTNS